MEFAPLFHFFLSFLGGENFREVASLGRIIAC